MQRIEARRGRTSSEEQLGSGAEDASEKAQWGYRRRGNRKRNLTRTRGRTTDENGGTRK